MQLKVDCMGFFELILFNSIRRSDVPEVRLRPTIKYKYTKLESNKYNFIFYSC